MSAPLPRREFVKQSAVLAGAIGAFTIVPRHVLGGPRQIPPSEKMNVAGIGIGGMGGGNLRKLEAENIVALCDVDPNYAAHTDQEAIRRPRSTSTTARCSTSRRTSTAWSSPRPTTPTRSISMAAMRAGKHVYCQKPLTHDVYEARMLAQVGQGVQGRHADGHPGPFDGRPPADLRVDLGGRDRRGPRGRRLVQPDLLSLGPRRLEFARGRIGRRRRRRCRPG